MLTKKMSIKKAIITIFVLASVLILSSSSAWAKSTATTTKATKYKFGARTGFSSEPGQFVFGVQGAFGRAGGAAGPAFFTPSADLGVGNDHTSLLINGDLRWYLARLPETGIRFYGAAGPTLGYYSASRGGSSTELGLSITAGARIPMQAQRSYNIEMRFGFGNIPDFKLMLALMF